MDNHNLCSKAIRIQVFSLYDNINVKVISVALSPLSAGKLFATGSGDCRARIWSYELNK